jgi:hypothetical protein
VTKLYGGEREWAEKGRSPTTTRHPEADGQWRTSGEVQDGLQMSSGNVSGGEEMDEFGRRLIQECWEKYCTPR